MERDSAYGRIRVAGGAGEDKGNLEDEGHSDPLTSKAGYRSSRDGSEAGGSAVVGQRDGEEVEGDSEPVGEGAETEGHVVPDTQPPGRSSRAFLSLSFEYWQWIGQS